MRLITGDNFKRLEFAKTHDLQSHVNERSKNLTHDQIVLIHDAVFIASNQSATKFMSDPGQSRVVQAHEALHAPLHPAACQDGKGPVGDAANGYFGCSGIPGRPHRVVQGA